MIYIPGKSLFIHIPRTSGMSLSLEAMKRSPARDVTLFALNSRVPVSVPFHRHSRACVLKSSGLVDPDVPTFTIARNPWVIAESTYLHFRKIGRYIRRAGKTPATVPEDLLSEIEKIKRETFPEFVIRHFRYLEECKPYGFYGYWCMDTSQTLWQNKGLGVKAFRYEDLDDPKVWSTVSDLFMLPAGSKRPKRSNASGRNGVQSVTWDFDSMFFISEMCHNEIEEFGYSRCRPRVL